MKYLMFDNGGVLDGTWTLDKPRFEDLLISEVEDGYRCILKDGVLIVLMLNLLITRSDYQIVFHSKNSEKDQIDLCERLKIASENKGVSFPEIYAMAVRDENVYKNIEANNPVIIRDRPHGIIVVGYGEELSGKSCVRIALSKLLDIKPEDRSSHVVFDDGAEVIKKARKEGYRGYLIGENGSRQISLRNAIEDVYLGEIEKAAKEIKHESKLDKSIEEKYQIEIDEDAKIRSLLATEPDEVIPNLFLGNLQAGDAALEQILTGDYSTAILRCTSHVIDIKVKDRLPAHLENGAKFKVISIGDSEKSDILTEIEGANEFIQQALNEKKRVLVHCDAGTSRSAAFVIAYLMKTFKYNFTIANNRLVKIRPCVNVQNFALQLQEYEKRLCPDVSQDSNKVVMMDQEHFPTSSMHMQFFTSSSAPPVPLPTKIKGPFEDEEKIMKTEEQQQDQEKLTINYEYI